MSSSDLSSSTMNSPARKKSKTRRGIACQQYADNAESSNQELPHEIPIYTSQIRRLRERKRLLAAERDNQPFDSEKEDESENICPTENSQGRVTRGHTKKESEVEAKKITPALIDSDVDDDLLPPPPAPSVVKRGRKTKIQKQQEILLRNLQTAQEMFKASKLLEKQSRSYVLGDGDLDVSIMEEEVAKEIQMKLRWRSQISRIPMKMNQRFYGVLPELSELCGVPSKELLLSVRDITIKPEDTPASLGLSIVDIIDCGVTTPVTSSADAAATKETEEDNTDRIRLRLQSRDQRSKLTLTVKKSELLCGIMEQYAEKQGLSLEKLTFKFDGETIGPEDTPEDLDLEDDFCIDVIVQS